jgi:hypothetical protein
MTADRALRLWFLALYAIDIVGFLRDTTASCASPQMVRWWPFLRTPARSGGAPGRLA